MAEFSAYRSPRLSGFLRDQFGSSTTIRREHRTAAEHTTPQKIAHLGFILFMTLCENRVPKRPKKDEKMSNFASRDKEYLSFVCKKMKRVDP